MSFRKYVGVFVGEQIQGAERGHRSFEAVVVEYDRSMKHLYDMHDMHDMHEKKKKHRS